MSVDRLRLLHGPYAAPAVGRGDVLTCERLGREVRVGGLSDAPIPWPRVLKTGSPSLILCEDLARAVRTESEIAVSHHWGVGVVTVWAWRKALGVGRVTEGTSRLHREYKPIKLPDDVAAEGRRQAALPENRAKMAEAKRGSLLPPQTRAALLAAVKGRKQPPDQIRKRVESRKAAKAARRAARESKDI
ncbi:MAG: hypothetical protein P4L67_04500 [Candidatus Pacebacteria bacterium]|nr:hypothetical protein [Candidatus Paceibacterota bacterium]